MYQLCILVEVVGVVCVLLHMVVDFNGKLLPITTINRQMQVHHWHVIYLQIPMQQFPLQTDIIKASRNEIQQSQPTNSGDNTSLWSFTGTSSWCYVGNNTAGA